MHFKSFYLRSFLSGKITFKRLISYYTEGQKLLRAVVVTLQIIIIMLKPKAYRENFK
jgi:hypothetical protein